MCGYPRPMRRLSALTLAAVLLLTPATADAHRLTTKRAKAAIHVKVVFCKHRTEHRVRCRVRTARWYGYVDAILKGRRVRLVRHLRRLPAAVPPTTIAPAAPPPPPAACSINPPAARLSYVDSAAWLRSQLPGLIGSGRRVATDGSVVYIPDGQGAYPAVWIRDFAITVEAAPGIVPPADIRDGFEYLAARQRDDGLVPDHVFLDGRPVYNIGGGQPPADNPQYLVGLAHTHWRDSGTTALFDDYHASLERAMGSVPRSASGLVWIDPAAPHSSWGANDWVIQTGDVLFASLLYVKAARQLGELYTATGDTADADRWEAEASRVQAALGTLWDSQSGMFYSATGKGHQLDIWGSALAVAEGMATADQADGVRSYLLANFDGLVNRGQIRQLPAGEYWAELLSPLKPGSYQNGAYWPFATGWVMDALEPIAPGRSEQLLRDVVADFRANGINEWMNDREICAIGVRQYLASGPLVAAAM